MTMAFFAGKKVVQNGRQMTVCAFPESWLKKYNWIKDPEADYGERFEDNPDYRKDLNLEITDLHASLIIDTLGYKIENGYWRAPIDEVIERAEKWLSLNDASNNYVKRLNGETVFGVFDLEYIINRLKEIIHIAKSGEEFDATIIYAA